MAPPVRCAHLFKTILLAATTATMAMLRPTPALSACTVAFCQSCIADPVCDQCDTGFQLISGANTCNDINECATNAGGCAVQAHCTNTPGSRTCTCNSGYGGDGVTCTDVNECATNNGGCSSAPLVTCTNSPGSFTCGACPSGYTGTGVTCTDVNECATNGGGCAVQAHCTNVPGSRTCTCNSGFAGDGITCVDVNECATSQGGCDSHATCTNQVGAPRICTCFSGYTGDGVTCSDINECATNNGGCDPHAQCANLPSTFSCTCNSGFSGNGATCADINECATAGGGCDPLTTCTNVPGTRTCSACPSGYGGTGDTACVDVNECTNDPCHAGACTNSPGSFTCDCPTGVSGTLCDTNGYVPPDKDTAGCENAVAYNVASYVKCITKCRVKKASKALGDKDFDEQGCQAGEKSACRSKYDKKMAKLIADGTCPACLDATTQASLADDALTGVIETKGRAFCAGSVPLAP